MIKTVQYDFDQLKYRGRIDIKQGVMMPIIKPLPIIN
jgi:hypothetical protein